MKINYTMFGTVLTGGVRVVLEIANALVNRGHEVTITSLRARNSHKWFPLKARVHYVEEPFPRKILKTLSYGLRRISDINTYLHLEIEDLTKAIPDCDINIATFCFTAFSVFSSERGISFYHIQHYEPLFYENIYLKKLAEETYYLPLNKFANSTWLHNQMKHRYGFHLPVINPGIDHNVFHPREAGKNTSKLRVLCFAKQTRWKGFPEALEAMRLVMKERHNVEFVAYGTNKPSYDSRIHYKFIKSPTDDELARLYSSADIEICPSWHESFPLTPLEGMACGLPIVTTPDGTEDYAHHEENSLVVPPRDPRALADAVLRLIEEENLREAFRKEGLKTAKQFTWERTVYKVEKLFEKALSKNQSTT